MNVFNRHARRRAKALSRKQYRGAVRPSYLAAGALIPLAAGAIMVFGSDDAHAQAVPLGTSDPAACVVNGTTATCTGDLSGGVDVDGPAIETLDINSLDLAITPAAGVDGINFASTTGITINADTGPFGINTSGTGDGINAALNGNDDLTIMSIGDITTETGEAFFANVTGDGNLTLTSTGDLTTGDSGQEGIDADITGNGNLTIESTGNITTGDSAQEAIDADINGNGNLTITTTGDLTTGDNSQEAIDTSINGNGNLTVTSVGNITSGGNDGIEASVIGTGNVTVSSTGDLQAETANFFGIEATVTAGSTATINLEDGTVSGGAGTGAGVAFTGPAGSTNVLNTMGDVTISAPSGNAVTDGAGDTTINNFGVLTTTTNGAIELGAGTNAFNNLEGATFNSGMVVNLGAGNLFINAGTLSPGGTGTILNTTITGNLVQTTTGHFQPTVDLTALTGDLLTVTGTADLSGTVLADDVVNPATGVQQVTILTATGGVTDNGLGLIASPVLQAELVFPNANDVVIQTNLDFTPDGVVFNPNQTNVGATLDAAAAAGGGGLTPLLDGIINGTSSVADVADAYDQLGAESFLNLQTTTLFSSLGFANSLLSCREADGVYAAISEGQCAWFQPLGRFLDRDATSTNVGFDEAAGGFATGAQFTVAPNWSVGFGFGYEAGSFDTDAGVDGDFDRFQGGLAVKYQKDAFLAAASLSGGTSQNDLTRAVTFGGLSLFPQSEPDVGFLTFQTRFAHLFETNAVDLKPQLDLSLTYLDLAGVTETGGGAANLTTSGESDVYFAASPSLEISKDYDLDSGMTVRAFADLGFTVFSDDSHAQTASFVSAPAGVSAFAVSTELDRVFGDVDVGATLFTEKGNSVTLRYQGRFSDDTMVHGAQLRASLKF
ncbi:MAG: autotransporter domain-containing protein [Pseudomonadota bacterium]